MSIWNRDIRPWFSGAPRFSDRPAACVSRIFADDVNSSVSLGLFRPYLLGEENVQDVWSHSNKPLDFIRIHKRLLWLWQIRLWTVDYTKTSTRHYSWIISKNRAIRGSHGLARIAHSLLCQELSKKITTFHHSRSSFLLLFTVWYHATIFCGLGRLSELTCEDNLHFRPAYWVWTSSRYSLPWRIPLSNIYGTI